MGDTRTDCSCSILHYTYRTNSYFFVFKILQIYNSLLILFSNKCWQNQMNILVDTESTSNFILLYNNSDLNCTIMDHNLENLIEDYWNTWCTQGRYLMIILSERSFLFIFVSIHHFINNSRVCILCTSINYFNDRKTDSWQCRPLDWWGDICCEVKMSSCISGSLWELFFGNIAAHRWWHFAS